MFSRRISRFKASIFNKPSCFVIVNGFHTGPSKLWKMTPRTQGIVGILLGVGASVAAVTTSVAFGESNDDEENELLENHILDVSCEVKSYDDGKKLSQKEASLKMAIKKSVLKLEQLKEETGSPGLVCAISVDGEVVLTQGLGFADVENGLKCHGKTQMRIASISKALTSLAIGKLVQDKKLDLDAPVQQYVEYFPAKEFNGEPVTITARQLMSHTSGIRHYEKELPEKEATAHERETTASLKKKSASEKRKTNCEDEKEGKRQLQNEDGKMTNDGEFKLKEYYIKRHYKTVREAVGLFKEDPLLKEPGSSYLYTTHGWTLLSACIEGASGKDYVTYMKELCNEIGLEKTFVELNDPIIYNRSRYYTRDSKGKLLNTPYVDNSYKWAGGGFLSTVRDLVQIGNAVMYSYQWDQQSSNPLKGYLDRDTVNLFWTPVQATIGQVSKKRKGMSFGLGWQLMHKKASFGCCGGGAKFAAMHTGAAVGASSVLLIVPKSAQSASQDISNGKDRGTSPKVKSQINSQSEMKSKNTEDRIPKGIVVAIMVNMQEVGLSQAALEIADYFIRDL